MNERERERTKGIINRDILISPEDWGLERSPLRLVLVALPSFHISKLGQYAEIREADP